MSFGDIDTLNLLFDKLQNLLNDTQGYYESFLDANTMYKQGKLTDKEFFEKLGDYVVSYSSLEFLSVKVIFELKKSLDKISSGRTSGSTMASPMPPGMGPQSSQVTSSTLPGLGQPPSIISAAAAFQHLVFYHHQILHSCQNKVLDIVSTCNSCGSAVKANAKFCPKCGNKIQQ